MEHLLQLHLCSPSWEVGSILTGQRCCCPLSSCSLHCDFRQALQPSSFTMETIALHCPNSTSPGSPRAAGQGPVRASQVLHSSPETKDLKVTGTGLILKQPVRWDKPNVNDLLNSSPCCAGRRKVNWFAYRAGSPCCL